MNRLIIKYKIKMILKQSAAKILEIMPVKPLDVFPEVTIFMSSFGTRYPMQLTIESMMRTTKYPNFRFLIAENGSTDGSREYLEGLQGKYPMDIISVSEPKMHKDWLNEVYQTIKTPYWLAVDTDMLFLGSDWLTDIIRVMEADPELYLLAAEKCKATYGMVEPVGHEVIDGGERFSTWLFCIRTSLREYVQTDFAFVVDHIDPNNGRKFCYDVGGKLLAEAQAKGIKTAYMPKQFLCKYHHFGSLSWNAEGTGMTDYQKLKHYQVNEIKRRVAGR